jgi:hypothetical protein
MSRRFEWRQLCAQPNWLARAEGFLCISESDPLASVIVLDLFENQVRPLRRTLRLKF